MQRYKLIIEYDGTPFIGWQRQREGPSVQQHIEEAIHAFCQRDVKLIAAGRTDAGVHARAMTAHFEMDRDLDTYRIIMALNAHLRDIPIRILDAEKMNPDFHARFSATSRSYQYVVLNRMAPPALSRDRVYHVPHNLDLNAMQEASKLLIGHHDFSTFRALSCQAKSPLRSITDFLIRKEGELLFFEVTAPSFLHHQIRNMVGSLLYVGQGKWTLNDFREAFNAKDRCAGGPTAPPQGLYFMKAEYC